MGPPAAVVAGAAAEDVEASLEDVGLADEVSVEEAVVAVVKASVDISSRTPAITVLQFNSKPGVRVFDAQKEFKKTLTKYFVNKCSFFYFEARVKTRFLKIVKNFFPQSGEERSSSEAEPGLHSPGERLRHAALDLQPDGVHHVGRARAVTDPVEPVAAVGREAVRGNGEGAAVALAAAAGEERKYATKWKRTRVCPVPPPPDGLLARVQPGHGDAKGLLQGEAVGLQALLRLRAGGGNGQSRGEGNQSQDLHVEFLIFF